MGPLPSATDAITITNFVEFVFSAHCVYIQSKKTTNYSKYSAFASSALFTSNSVVFVSRGARIFLASGVRAQGTLATPLATGQQTLMLDNTQAMQLSSFLII